MSVGFSQAGATRIISGILSYEREQARSPDYRQGRRPGANQAIRRGFTHGSSKKGGWARVYLVKAKPDYIEFGIADTALSGGFVAQWVSPFLSDENPVFETLGEIAFDATASDVQDVLRAVESIGSDVTCSGGPLPDTPIIAQFTGDFEGVEIPLPTVLSSTLDGGIPVIAHYRAFLGDTSEEIVAKNVYANLGTSKHCHVVPCDGAWELIAGECT